MPRPPFLLERTSVLGGPRAGMDNLEESKISCASIKLSASCSRVKSLKSEESFEARLCSRHQGDSNLNYPVRILAAVPTALSRVLYTCWR